MAGARSTLSSRHACALSVVCLVLERDLPRSPGSACALAGMPQLLESSYQFRNEAPYYPQLAQQAGGCTAGARSSLRLAARGALSGAGARSPAISRRPLRLGRHAPAAQQLPLAHIQSPPPPHAALSARGAAWQVRIRRRRCPAHVRSRTRTWRSRRSCARLNALSGQPQLPSSSH